MLNPILNKFKAFTAVVVLVAFSCTAIAGGADAHAHDSNGHHTQEAGAEETGYNPTPMIMHHIEDANDWHLFGHVAIPLPVFIYNVDKGTFFAGMSSQFDHGHKEVAGYIYDHGRIKPVDGSKIIDFSITKNVATLLLAAIILLIVFTNVAKAYQKREGQAPKGLQSLFEPIILFVRNDIAKPNLGHKTEKFLPYLLSIFFFIWTLNLLGLIPSGANASGNIAVTVALGLFTLVVININGNKHYWAHIFMPPVPKPLWLIMWPVEIAGIFIKPIALMVRLFANITAGHIIVLSLISLVFVFGNAGQSVGGGFGGSAIAVPFALFIMIIELLVAFLQAFIFTMLSAVFIGMAVAEEH